MKDIKLFERELDLIVNEDLRMLTKAYLEERVADYFWEIGASSSGKYHPSFSQNVGGLVRHTKAVVMFAEELLRMNTYAYLNEEYKDYIIVACLVHDTCKLLGIRCALNFLSLFVNEVFPVYHFHSKILCCFCAIAIIVGHYY
mgnify:CR=1 FL=1